MYAKNFSIPFDFGGFGLTTFSKHIFCEISHFGKVSFIEISYPCTHMEVSDYLENLGRQSWLSIKLNLV